MAKDPKGKKGAGAPKAKRGILDRLSPILYVGIGAAAGEVGQAIAVEAGVEEKTAANATIGLGAAAVALAPGTKAKLVGAGITASGVSTRAGIAWDEYQADKRAKKALGGGDRKALPEHEKQADKALQDARDAANPAQADHQPGALRQRAQS
jgi:hypothetical protein